MNQSVLTQTELATRSNPVFKLNASTSSWNCDVYYPNTDTVLNFVSLSSNAIYRIQLNSNQNRYLTACGTTAGSNVEWKLLGEGGTNAQNWKLVMVSIPDYPTPAERIDTLVDTAEHCLGYTLAQCAQYFDVSNPGVQWCAWFARMCGLKAGLYFGTSDQASQLLGINGNYSFSSSGINVGDLAFVDTSGGSTIKHVGIVVEISSTKIYTVEGNMSGSVQTSIVKRANYDRSNGVSSSYGKIVKYGKNT